MMGKRSYFERVERDFYPTPYEAVAPLIPHLRRGLLFTEPCAGDGALIAHLGRHGFMCRDSMDIEPRDPRIRKGDALEDDLGFPETFITNPPWDRKILHPLIERLSEIAPTWLLFDADWMHTRQSRPYMSRCYRIVSVGRVRWIPDSKMTGKDNCAWYLFGPIHSSPTEFYGR